MNVIYIVSSTDYSDRWDPAVGMKGVFTDLALLKSELFAQGISFNDFERHYDANQTLTYATYDLNDFSIEIQAITPNMLDDITS
jgi:hypothetical protein